MFIIGFIMGFAMVASGGDQQDLQRNITKYALIIEIVVVVGTAILVTVLGKSMYGKQEAQRALQARSEAAIPAIPVTPPAPDMTPGADQQDIT